MAFTRQELIGEVTSLSLINRNGTALESFAVQRGDGIYAGSYYVLFAPSLQRFRFQVNAKTTKGKLLRRIKPTEINIGTVELGFNYRLSNSYTRIFPGISREISLKIKNTGTSQNFTLKATDDLEYVQSLVPGHCFVAENETVEFTLELRAPYHNSQGNTSTIAVYATATNSDQPSNYMVFYVSVTTKVSEMFTQVFGNRGFTKGHIIRKFVISWDLKQTNYEDRVIIEIVSGMEKSFNAFPISPQ